MPTELNPLELHIVEQSFSAKMSHCLQTVGFFPVLFSIGFLSPCANNVHVIYLALDVTHTRAFFLPFRMEPFLNCFARTYTFSIRTVTSMISFQNLFPFRIFRS